MLGIADPCLAWASTMKWTHGYYLALCVGVICCVKPGCGCSESGTPTVLADYPLVKPFQVCEEQGHISLQQVEMPARQGEWFSCLTTCRLGFPSVWISFSDRRGLGWVLLPPKPSPIYWPCSYGARSMRGGSLLGLAHCSGSRHDEMTDPKSKPLSRATEKKPLEQNENLIEFVIKLCDNDHSLIGLLFLRIGLPRRCGSRKCLLVQLKSISVMWFAEAVFLRWAGGVGSFSELAGTACTSISALFFVGGLNPVELLRK